MPIDTTSAAWEAPDAKLEAMADAGESWDPLATQADIFLQENADTAYSIFELADELLDTDWTGEGSAAGDREGYRVVTTQLQASLRMLVAAGNATVRFRPPADPATAPVDAECDVPYVTHADRSDLR